MIDLTTYALLRKQITSAVSGVNDVRAEGDELVFVLADGHEVRMAIPATEIRDAVVRDDVLVLTLVDGKEVVVDATLTQSGQAADAKATGDAVSQLKNDLGDKQDALTAGDGIVIYNNVISVKGEKYALIENITLDEETSLVVRSQAPDGDDYCYLKMLVIIDAAQASKSDNITVIFRRENSILDSDNIATALLIDAVATTTKSSAVELEIVGSIAYLFVRSTSNGLAANPNTNSVGYYELSDECYVKKVYVRSTTNIPAGTSIRIYGTR